MGQTLQTSAESLNRFIDDGATRPAAAEPARKDFWDTFGSSAMVEEKKSGGSGAIGTAAMRKGGGGGKDEGWGVGDDKW